MSSLLLHEHSIFSVRYQNKKGEQYETEKKETCYKIRSRWINDSGKEDLQSTGKKAKVS
jgi:hypothetical protein